MNSPARFFRRLGFLRLSAAALSIGCLGVGVGTGIEGLLPAWASLLLAIGGAGCAAAALEGGAPDEHGSAAVSALAVLAVPLLVGCAATWAVHGLSGSVEVDEGRAHAETGAVICHGAICLDVRTWYTEVPGVADVCVEVVGVDTWCRTVSGGRDESGRPVGGDQ